ncbi:ribosome small subunit-dependent GTPase A [Lapidilactobacillus bayanensis]|uniref:ribosome small subunit-dependent GTPase A n=1 Tax=Lapidilactobacillus bayanensis TaxID=2485998 RepID=UPI000F7A5BED|nr:ribosome small subunit-dependent GTPase A [Lapidilactobacillus bayanensis]
MQTGKIIKSISGFYDVLTGEGTIERTRARGNFRQQKIKPVVGDHVEFEAGYILAVQPRRNVLVRPPMANLDLAIVVMSAVEPDFSTNLLDRYLVYLAANKMDALIYVSKTDLLSESQLTKLTPIFDAYLKIGYQVYTHQTSDFADIEAAAAGKTLMVMGQSGAGKSTLLNHLLPELKLTTAEISQSLNRGRHTTRTVTLYPLGVGGAIADTPGFSSLDLSQLDVGELGQYFVEFPEIADGCRFRGCQHLREPDCVVKAAVEKGTIANFRYADYLQIHDELSHLRPVYRKS